MIVADLPAGERPELRRVQLVAPTSTDERIRLAAEQTDGWLYLVTRHRHDRRARRPLPRARRPRRAGPPRDRRLPLYAGFGISTPEQARAAAELADGIVVGTSALEAAEAARERSPTTSGHSAQPSTKPHRQAENGDVLIDARNVLRSQWPNVPEDELVERCRAWAARHDHDLVLVFDGTAPGDIVGVEQLDDRATLVGSGGESADDWLAREAPSYPGAWLVTSDRELRARAGGDAIRIVGGGSFLRELET